MGHVQPHLLRVTHALRPRANRAQALLAAMPKAGARGMVHAKLHPRTRALPPHASRARARPAVIAKMAVFGMANANPTHAPRVPAHRVRGRTAATTKTAAPGMENAPLHAQTRAHRPHASRARAW